MFLLLATRLEMAAREVSSVGDMASGRAPSRSGNASRLARGLLTSFQKILVEPPADLRRARTAAPESRKGLAKHDAAVLHIIRQYPGCNDARILAFLRTRVDWFGRGTMVDKLFRPSLRTVQAAVHRLEVAGEIKTDVQQSHRGHMLRFFPNVPIWPGSENDGNPRGR
jgi:hypothetical protein